MYIDWYGQAFEWAGRRTAKDVWIGEGWQEFLCLTAVVVAVVNVAKDASLVVYLSSVWIVPDGLLQQVQDGGWLLLDDVDAASRRAGAGACRTTLKCQNASTLAKRGDVVEPPFLDDGLRDGAHQSDAVDVKLDVDSSLFNALWLRHFTRVDVAWRVYEGES